MLGLYKGSELEGLVYEQLLSFESNSLDDPLPVHIQSLNKKPIAVTQFAYTQIQDQGVGDPEMIILNASEQNSKDVPVFLSLK